MALTYGMMNFIDDMTSMIVDFVSWLNKKQKTALLEILATTIDELIHNKSTHG